MTVDVLDRDATGRAELVRGGACTPAELLEAAIAAIVRLNPRLNPVNELLFKRARAQLLSLKPEDLT